MPRAKTEIDFTGPESFSRLGKVIAQISMVSSKKSEEDDESSAAILGLNKSSAMPQYRTLAERKVLTSSTFDHGKAGELASSPRIQADWDFLPTPAMLPRDGRADAPEDASKPAGDALLFSKPQPRTATRQAPRPSAAFLTTDRKSFLIPRERLTPPVGHYTPKYRTVDSERSGIQHDREKPSASFRTRMRWPELVQDERAGGGAPGAEAKEKAGIFHPPPPPPTVPSPPASPTPTPAARGEAPRTTDKPAEAPPAPEGQEERAAPKEDKDKAAPAIPRHIAGQLAEASRRRSVFASKVKGHTDLARPSSCAAGFYLDPSARLEVSSRHSRRGANVAFETMLPRDKRPPVREQTVHLDRFYNASHVHTKPTSLQPMAFAKQLPRSAGTSYLALPTHDLAYTFDDRVESRRHRTPVADISRNTGVPTECSRFRHEPPDETREALSEILPLDPRRASEFVKPRTSRTVAFNKMLSRRPMVAGLHDHVYDVRDAFVKPQAPRPVRWESQAGRLAPSRPLTADLDYTPNLGSVFARPHTVSIDKQVSREMRDPLRWTDRPVDRQYDPTYTLVEKRPIRPDFSRSTSRQDRAAHTTQAAVNDLSYTPDDRILRTRTPTFDFGRASAHRPTADRQTRMAERPTFYNVNLLLTKPTSPAWTIHPLRSTASPDPQQKKEQRTATRG